MANLQSTSPGEQGGVRQQQQESSGILDVTRKRQDSATDGAFHVAQVNGNSRNFSHASETQHHTSSSHGEPNARLRESISQTDLRIRKDFSHGDSLLLDTMTIEKFSDFIARERLSSMPHRGSLWDRVLRWAEFYALQVAAYADTIGNFVPESRSAASQIYMLLRSLLELGEANASALDTTFGVFYKLGLSLSFLSSNKKELSLNSDIREDVGRIFHVIHILVFEVASHYQRSVRGLHSGSVHLDFIALFRSNLSDFYQRKSSIVNQIWKHHIGGHASNEIQDVRKWLSQRAFLPKSIAAHDYIHKSQYDEYTCEWFQRHLLEFTRSDKQILAITAGPGCGKTTLSSWIHERLQRPLDKKTYSTVMFSFDADVPGQCTSLAVAKSLAFQLLDIHLGNTRMFHAIVKAYHCDNVKDMENHLWDAIDAAFPKSTEREPVPTMIIIDGLDQSRDKHQGVSEHITKLTQNHKSVSSIVLTRPEAVHSDEKSWKIFSIKPDHVYEDIHHIARQTLQHCAPFRVLKENEKNSLLERLTKSANGCFLWLSLATNTFRTTKSIEEVEKYLKDAQSLNDLVKKRVASIDFSDADIKHLISYLLISERPLTATECVALLQVDIQRKTHTQRHIELSEKLAKTVSLLQLTESGVIKFRHSFIRSFFLTMQANREKLLGVKEAHTDLTSRLLLFSKFYLNKDHEISFEPLPHGQVERLFTDHHLLEYAVRTWTYHFHHSTLWKPTGPLELSNDFKAIYPNSPMMVLLEWTCWSEHNSKRGLLDMHDLTLRVRSEVLGQHPCTLQNVITCAFVHQKYSSPSSAAHYFYRASIMGQAILPKNSKITIRCTELFLSISEEIKTTTRTEIVTFREQMLRYIIETAKHEHGDSSDVVVRYYQALAELYASIHEEEHAATCWKELRVIIVGKHGEDSDEARKISGKLMVVLKGNEDFEIEHYRGDIFSISEENVVVWDLARIQIFLRLARACEERKEYYEAEEIYVTLWTRLLHLCRHQYSHDIEYRINMFKIAIEYVHFLRRQQRVEEAKNILIVLWTEHQHFGCESEAFYQQLVAIAELMRTLELHSISISVFEKIVQWYKAVGKHDHAQIRHCESVIIEVIQQITEKQTTNNTSRSESSTDIETIVRRMLSSMTVVNKDFINVTRTAVSVYVKREQWSEAITVLTKALELLWVRSSWGGERCLPELYVGEAIEFAIELSRCHMRLKQHQESLSCYLQLWQAVRSSCAIGDKRRTIVMDALVLFYTEHKRWRALIELRRELLIEYRRHYGKSHEHTVALLYTLGDLCLEHGHGYAEDYYREIVEVVGTTNTKLSFRAYQLLCRIYYEENNWVELKVVSDVLWTLFVSHHKDHTFHADFAEMLFIRYMYVLRHHHRCDHAHLVKIAQQYKQTCIEVFGASSAIAVRARIEHASVLMEHESTMTEAVGAYEDITNITRTNKSIVDETTLSLVKKQMVAAYIHAHSSGKATGPTNEKAITVLQERFEHLKATMGIAHSETLTILEKLVSMHAKLNNAEHKKQIVQKLQTTVVEIITKEKRSEVLFEAASTIGTLYIASGLTHEGRELMQEIRRQLISDHAQESKLGFKMDKSIGRVTFVFLVAFELTLKGSVSHSYSEIMANWLTESILFESFNHAINNKTKVDVLLLRSAQLRSFWITHERHEEVTRLDSQVLDVFMKQYGTLVKTRPEMVKIFLIAVLQHVGSGENYNVHVARVASLAGNRKVEELFKTGQYQAAHEVGHCTYHFVMSQGGHHKATLIGDGFTLAKYMAARKYRHMIPGELRSKMLQTSREIMGEVLHACKELDINFLQLHDHELIDLVELLGDQENYKELEVILESLWRSRHGQKHWSEETIINLGLRLVQSRFLASTNGHSHSAIHLAEDINYNLRRVLGGLHPHALRMSTLLAELYTSAKQYGDALNVHEDILQLIVAGDDGDDRTTDSVTAKVAMDHLRLLTAAYQRNQGWVKSPQTYKTLIDQLLVMYKGSAEFKDVQPTDKWQPKQDEAMAQVGVFSKPEKWSSIASEDGRGVEGSGGVKQEQSRYTVKSLPPPVKREKSAGWSLRRISENWGMSLGGKEDKHGAAKVHVDY